MLIIFIKKIFYIGFSKCNSTELYFIKKSKCKVRPKIAVINSNNPIFYLFSIKINNFSGKCNIINNPNAKICVSDTVKDMFGIQVIVSVNVINLAILVNI